MKQNLNEIIEEAARERGIGGSVLVSAIESGIALAAQRKSGEHNLRAKFNTEDGTFSLTQALMVKDDPLDDSEISLAEARAVKEDVRSGDTLEIPFDFPDLGRLAAQTTRGVMRKNLRELETEQRVAALAQDYGKLIVATVVGKSERDEYLLKAGETLAVLSRKEQAFRESFHNGEVIKVIIVGAEPGGDDPVYTVSRTHPLLLRHLFAREVPEVADGVVVIKALARDTSGRAKVAVVSTKPNVDPVGTCIGPAGQRVKNIIKELKGENIDIIPWSENPEAFIAAALTPAKVKRVRCDWVAMTGYVELEPDQQSIAVGKGGLNIRLASRLTRWTINVK